MFLDSIEAIAKDAQISCSSYALPRERPSAYMNIGKLFVIQMSFPTSKAGSK